jgi:hypothetical protein
MEFAVFQEAPADYSPGFLAGNVVPRLGTERLAAGKIDIKCRCGSHSMLGAGWLR